MLLGLARAKPRVVQPVMKVETLVPSDKVVDIIQDFRERGGTITDQKSVGPTQVMVEGQAFMSELLGYDEDLQKITDGRGSNSMGVVDFDFVPADQQDELVAEFGKK